MTTRREFLKTSGLAAAALSVGGCRSSASTAGGAGAVAGGAPSPVVAPAAPAAGGNGAVDASVRMLLMEALDAAKLAGASYADARIGRYRNGFVATRERQIVQVADTETMGCGVRVLVDGTWGFAATN